MIRRLLSILFGIGLIGIGAAAPVRAADRPNLEQHAGQAIHREAEMAPAVQAPAPIAPSAPMDFDSGRVALALIGVIGVILLLRYAGKYLFPSVISAGRSRTVRVLARCPLAPRQQVVLIQVGKRIIIAADCASHLSSLSQITDPDEIAALIGQLESDKSAPVASPFAAWFNRAAESFAVQTAHSEETPAEPDPQLADLTARVRDLSRRWSAAEKNA